MDILVANLTFTLPASGRPNGHGLIGSENQLVCECEQLQCSAQWGNNHKLSHFTAVGSQCQEHSCSAAIPSAAVQR